jgi:hypothetical protein
MESVAPAVEGRAGVLGGGDGGARSGTHDIVGPERLHAANMGGGVDPPTVPVGARTRTCPGLNPHIYPGVFVGGPSSRL